MPENKTNIIFIELQAGSENNKPFDALTHGEFIDMWGREVVISKEDLKQFVSNTVDVIETTRTESGELVGLPIDSYGHVNGDSVGWIKGVQLSDDHDKLQVIPEWNDEGLNVIKNKIRRFFSASINLKYKTVLGGSLTNWPAVREESGKLLLRPIELSEGTAQTIDQIIDDHGVDIGGDGSNDNDNLISGSTKNNNKKETSKMNDLSKVSINDLVEANPDVAKEYDNLIEQRAKEKADQMVELARRNDEIIQLCDELIGGDGQNVLTGLPVAKDDLVDFMQSLSKDQADKAEGIFKKIQADGLIKFSETGHNKSLKGSTQLPKEYHAYLQKWVDQNKNVADFFTINAGELGNMDDYDLSDFEIE